MFLSREATLEELSVVLNPTPEGESHLGGVVLSVEVGSQRVSGQSAAVLNRANPQEPLGSASLYTSSVLRRIHSPPVPLTKHVSLD